MSGQTCSIFIKIAATVAYSGEKNSPERVKILARRPSWAQMWKNYPVKKAAPDVWKMVGGKAYETFLWGEQQVKEGKLTSNPYLNACALRFSRALNYSGMKIPSIPSLNGGKLTGEDKLNYMIRVKDVVNFVETHLKEPDYSESPAPGVDLTNDPYLLAHKGILHFDVSGWKDASGHITLWDGCDCGDSCYFMPSGAILKKLNFWELK